MTDKEILKQLSVELKQKLSNDKSFENLIRELVFANNPKKIAVIYKSHRPEANESIKLKELVKESVSHKYSFKDLTKMIRDTDYRNPNEKQRKQAEAFFKKIGFFDKKGEIISKNFDNTFRTTDGKTLQDLDNWYERNML